MWQTKPEREQKEETKQSRWGFRGMTVRDWLPIVGALLIPVVIAAGTWGITWQQGKIEDQRAQAERELEQQRAQDAALQAYFDQMKELLLEKDLRNSERDSEVRTVARAQTLTTLDQVESSRKRRALLFLYEANLIVGEHPTIQLDGANLRNLDLSEPITYQTRLFNRAVVKFVVPTQEQTTGWRGVNLSGADLSNANLSDLDLRGSHLREVNLRGTDLSMANLSGAILNDALLVDTDLSRAVLTDADLVGSQLVLVIGLEALAANSNLTASDLKDLQSHDAVLSGATLQDADLTRADISSKQLRQCKSLNGTTMPNGQKYEDWLKDREKR